MKRTIRLSESKLRSLIQNAINEAGEQFDWSAFENPELWNDAARDAKYLKAQMDGNLDYPYDSDPYYHGEYDKEEDNDYSWERWDNRPVALSPISNTWSSANEVPDDIDYAIDNNNKRLYGDEAKTELIGKQAREKWVNGASPDYMAGWTDAKLESIVRESVRRTLNENHWNPDVYDRWMEVRELIGDDTMIQELYNYLSGDQIEDFLNDHIGRQYGLNQTDESRLRNMVSNAINEVTVNNPTNNLEAVEAELSKNNFPYSTGKFEAELAEFLVDNGLDTNILLQYPHIHQAVDNKLLANEIEKYQQFLKQDAEDDKRREAQAWAEEQMSDMGFGYEND